MTERQLNPPRAPHEDLEQFLGELARQAVRPPGNDRVIGALCVAAYHDIVEGGPLRPMMEDVLENRISSVASETVGAFRASVQTDQLKYGADFPNDRAYRQVDGWRDVLRDVASHYDITSTRPAEEQDRGDSLTYNLWTRHVQTNIADRYLPIEYLLQRYRNRYPTGADWLDPGCGILQGQHLLLNKSRRPLPEVTVVDAQQRPRPEATQEVRELLARDSVIHEAYGIDLMSAYDSHTQAWARGSLRPEKELGNAAFMEQFDDLTMSAAAEQARFGDRVQFDQVDLLSETSRAEFAERHPGKTFDALSLATMLHQLTNGERQAMLEQAKRYVRPEGLLIIQDFAWLAPGSRAAKTVRFYQHWHVPYRYRTYLWDARRPERGIREVLRSKDSRCHTWQLVDEAGD